MSAEAAEAVRLSRWYKQVQASMQKHEGPRRNQGAERHRQRVLTVWLSMAILLLSGLLAVTLFNRM